MKTPSTTTGLAHELAVPGLVAPRLVVLVPDVVQTALVAARIHELAAARGQRVLILGMVSEPDGEPGLRRKLALLSAFLQDAGTSTEVRLREAREALGQLESILGPGDLLAYCASDTEAGAADRWTDLLGRRFRRPVYIFMDEGAETAPKTGALRQLAPWLGSVVVIMGFLWLQIWLTEASGLGPNNGWLVASMPAEIALIWLVNVLVG